MRVRMWGAVCVLFALLLPLRLVAQAVLPVTTVSDAVYGASGNPAAGSVVVSWGAFTTAGGTAVPAGSAAATIGQNGLLMMQLTPNAGATPAGSYYTAVFHLSDGTVSREYWVVPAMAPGGAAVKLAAIRNQVLPVSVAMQTVSKSYVDTAIAAAVSGHPLDSSPYVVKSGDSMTGPLALAGDPVNPTQAADKNYADASVAAVGAGLGQKLSKVPAGTQAVLQPAGTQLEVSQLNGTLNPELYLSGAGRNGIVNATASADCANGCAVRADGTYDGGEQTPDVLPARTQVEDDRGGSKATSFTDPQSPFTNGASVGEDVTVVSRRSAASAKTLNPGANEVDSIGLRILQRGLAGGNNQFPESIEVPPYFKSTYSALSIEGRNNTAGQHVLFPELTRCYGVGDCLLGSQEILSSGGYRDSADEGAHPFDLYIGEDDAVFTGTCAGNCQTGATTLTVAATTAAGTEGDGRFLIDMNPAKVMSAGTITGGSGTVPFQKVTFTGTQFPVSVMLQMAAAAKSQMTDIAPGTVTLPIATSGVGVGYSTTTAALPAMTGVACVVDGRPNTDNVIPNFETAAYSVVDGSHLQLTLRKVHGAGATVSVGGLCGYGLEEMADTVGSIRQVFPVVGSLSGTQLYYVGGQTGVVGTGTTGAFLNVQQPIQSAVRQNGVVTITTANYLPADYDGLTMTVSGTGDQSFSGTFPMTTTSTRTLTYASAGPDGSTAGGTLGFLNGGYKLYPMAEVVSAMNPATGAVDGTMVLGANTAAWAQGDPVQMPHYYQMITHGDLQVIAQTMPRPTFNTNEGKEYDGIVGPGVDGFLVRNAGAATQYLGYGGTHQFPGHAFSVQGLWQNSIEAMAGENAVLRVHCNGHGCGRWDSSYYVFQMDSQTTADGLLFSPSTDTATMQMGLGAYTFSPTALTAPAIHVGTLDATTITGGVSGGAITSGTVPAARLPVFGASGLSHAPGAVPDPGATPGLSRFLREDGTWQAVAASSGGSNSGGGGASGAVAITSGTIDGATIGGSQPGAARFTTMSASGMSYFGNGQQMQIYPDGGISSAAAGIFGYLSSHSTLYAGSGAQFAVDVSGNVTAPSYHETLTTPASSSAPCNAGDFTDDAEFHYVCVAANTWKRVALSSF